MNTSIGTRLLVASALGTLLAVAGCQQEIISHAPQARADGVKAFEEGQYADAAGSFRNAIRSDPRDYKSQFYLGQSYEQMKQYQQAIQAYKASLDAQPLTLAGKDDKAQRQMTINAMAASISRSDTRDAEVDLVEKQARASNKPQDYLLLAKIYQNRGDADSALDAYNRAALTDPKDFVVVKEYGLYLEQLGQAPKATIQLKKAYGVNPNDAQVNAALYRLNVIPGPGLKDEAQLAKPAIPAGPLPELSTYRSPTPSKSPSRDTAAGSYTPPPGSPPTSGALPTVPRATTAEPRD